MINKSQEKPLKGVFCQGRVLTVVRNSLGILEKIFTPGKRVYQVLFYTIAGYLPWLSGKSEPLSDMKAMTKVKRNRFYIIIDENWKQCFFRSLNSKRISRLQLYIQSLKNHPSNPKQKDSFKSYEGHLTYFNSSYWIRKFSLGDGIRLQNC